MFAQWRVVFLIVFGVLLLMKAAAQEPVAFSNSSNSTTPVNVSLKRKVRPHATGVHTVVNNYYLLRFTRELYNVTSMDLSSHGIDDITGGAFASLGNLRHLTLARNNIRIIRKGAFRGLKKLFVLNLKWNPLIRWDGNIRGDLPQLNLLDVTGITHWKPDYEFLQLESLVEIRGASWNLDCNTCSLVKNYTIHRKYACTSLPEINKGECLTCPLTSCACTKYMYTNYTLLLAQRDFVYGKCNNTEQCYKSISRRKAANPCLSAGRNLFILQSVIGTIGLILNVIVIVIVLVTPKLRKNASMLLTCNMAFCDFLNCTYAILASFLYLSFPTEEFVAIKIQICPLVGSAWLLGQCGVAVTSAIMTFERHRAVAFATNPMMRLTLRQAIYAVMAAWFITGSILAYALLYKLFSYNSLCIPIAVSIDTPRLFGFSIFLCLLASVLYLFNVPLYIHIYIVVKKSSQRMRVRRESAVAKRIALLVVTNMAFFFLPIVIYGIMMTLGKIEAPAHTDWDKTNVLVFLIPVITPMYCLILNSCINPLLHAFRNETFREALKTWCCCWSPQHTAVVAVLQPQGSYKKSSSEETRNKQK